MNVDQLAKLAEQDLSSLEKVMDALPAPIYMKDIQGRYILCNQAFADLWGKANSSAIVGKTLVDLSNHEQALDLHQRDLTLLKNPGCRVDEVDVSAMLNKHVILHFHGCSTKDGSGQVSGIVGLVFDITARAELERKLEQLSQMDELTQIPNRRHGMARLDSMVSHSKRHQFACCLLMMDIDHFKAVNDQHGHRAGDMVLQRISALLSEMARTSDTVFRFGGEEFVLLLPNTDLEGGAILGERIREAVESESILINAQKHLSVTLSLGIASFPQHAESARDLLSVADQALYKAKETGRNTIVSAEELG